MPVAQGSHILIKNNIHMKIQKYHYSEANPRDHIGHNSSEYYTTIIVTRDRGNTDAQTTQILTQIGVQVNSASI